MSDSAPNSVPPGSAGLSPSSQRLCLEVERQPPVSAQSAGALVDLRLLQRALGSEISTNTES